MTEWVKYSPYGVAFGLPGCDTDSDGECAEEIFDTFDDCFRAAAGQPSEISECMDELLDALAACTSEKMKEWFKERIQDYGIDRVFEQIPMPMFDCHDQCNFEYYLWALKCTIGFGWWDRIWCLAKNHANFISCYTCCAFEDTRPKYDDGYDCDEKYWDDKPRDPPGRR